MQTKWKINLKLLGLLSFSRLINAAKLSLSYSLSSFLKRPILGGLPISIAYEPTTSCNLRCPECPSGLRSFSRATGDANLIDFEKLIDQVRKHVMYITLYFQGEPYLNSSFFDMISYAKKARMFTVTSTNAHYLSEENCKKTILSGLDKLIISLDGISQESYGKYRVGGKLEKVIEGITTLSAMKKKMRSSHPFIIIQTIAFSHNEHELEEIKGMKEVWGVDEVQIKTAQVYNIEDSDLLPKDPSLSRYQMKDGKYQLNSVLPNRCWRMWSSPVVMQDGQLIPCCFDKDGEHSMGNSLLEKDFKTIWKGQHYQDFRKQVFLDRKAIDICKNCSEGVKVWN
jgi:radical SAM protein with 4Fe4S-binding SPASM domain